MKKHTHKMEGADRTMVAFFVIRTVQSTLVPAVPNLAGAVLLQHTAELDASRAVCKAIAPRLPLAVSRPLQP